MFQRPVVRLLRALYGHPDAETYWEVHCDKAVREVGFEPIQNWPSCYFHAKLKLFLVVCVDDFKLAGPSVNISTGWKLTHSRISLGDLAPANLYLGCLHGHQNLALKTGKQARAVVYNMEEYLKSTVDRYRTLVRQNTGKDPVLRQAHAPFLAEDHQDAPAARPVAGGGSTTCLRRKAVFRPQTASALFWVRGVQRSLLAVP